MIEHPAKIETTGIMADNAIRIVRRRVVSCLTYCIVTVVTTNAIILYSTVVKEGWQETCRGMTVSAVACRFNMTVIFTSCSYSVMTPHACP